MLCRVVAPESFRSHHAGGRRGGSAGVEDLGADRDGAVAAPHRAGVVVQQRELAERRVENGLLDGLVSAALGRGLAVRDDRVEDVVLAGGHVAVVRVVRPVAGAVLPDPVDDALDPVERGSCLVLRAAGLGEGLVDDLLDGDVVGRGDGSHLFHRCDQGGDLGCVECHLNTFRMVDLSDETNLRPMIHLYMSNGNPCIESNELAFHINAGHDNVADDV